jgi:hypothetical protein
MAHHVPEKVCYPVDVWSNTADEVKMFSFGCSFIDQEHHETGRNKRQGEHDANGNQDVNSTLNTAGKYLVCETY